MPSMGFKMNQACHLKQTLSFVLQTLGSHTVTVHNESLAKLHSLTLVILTVHLSGVADALLSCECVAKITAVHTRRHWQ